MDTLISGILVPGVPVLDTEDELRAVCRRQGVERLEDMEKAILETSGTIPVFTRHPGRALRRPGGRAAKQMVREVC